MTYQDLQAYFSGEKSESLLFIAVGITTLIGALVCFFVFKKSFYVGLAIPLALVGAIQLVVGGAIYMKTDKQMFDLSVNLQQSSKDFKETELMRMAVVNKNFVIYRYTEIALLLIGLALFAWKFSDKEHFWFGLGSGLALQSALMLGLDYFAEARAGVYTDLLRNLTV